MKKRIFYSFLILSFCINNYAQTIVEQKQQIVNKIISFQQIRYSKPDKAKKIIEDAIQQAKNINSKEDLLTCKILLGEYYDDNNNFNAAYQEYEEANKLASEIGDKDGLALTKYDLGILFYKQNSTEKRKKALNYLNESIHLSKETKDDFLRAKALNFSSFINYDLNNLTKAEENSLEALFLFKKTNKQNRIPQCFITLSRVYNKKDEFDKAIRYLDSAIILYKNLDIPLELNNALLVKSEIYLHKQNYDEALSIAKKINDDPKVMTEQKIYALQLLYEINKAMNNHKKSLDYLEENKFITDSLYKLDRDKMMESVRSEIEAKNRLAILENENQINELNIKQNQYWIFILVSISALLMLAVIIAFLILRQSKMRAERQRIEMEQASIQLEQKLLRTQMNPHFIANALAAIQGNIYKQDKEKSITYLSKFAKLMRFILESSREKEVLLSKEINSLTHYLDLQKLLLEEKLQYSICIEKTLHTEELKIPPMLIQPFVENAIKHGIELKEGEGNVSIKFNKKNQHQIEVIIEDNGLGRKAVGEIYKERKSNHLSFSTNITKERIKNLNTHSASQFTELTEDIIENHKIEGTRVTLNIPVKSLFD